MTRLSPGAPVTEALGGKPFPLDKLFQEGSDIHEEASVKTKEQDDHGTAQTSIRHHPRTRSARRAYAVAPMHTSGVALRHVGPRDATSVPLLILTANLLHPGLVTSRLAPVRGVSLVAYGTMTIAWRSVLKPQAPMDGGAGSPPWRTLCLKAGHQLAKSSSSRHGRRPAGNPYPGSRDPGTPAAEAPTTTWVSQAFGNEIRAYPRLRAAGGFRLPTSVDPRVGHGPVPSF